MVDPDVFDRRLGKLEDVLRNLRRLAKVEYERIRSDVGLQAQAERWLYVAAECCLDLAHHLISSRGWKTPTTYREAFVVLESEGVLESGLSRAMQGWAGLRNILAHLYLEVDHARLHEILVSDLDDLEAYAVAVRSHVDQNEVQP